MVLDMTVEEAAKMIISAGLVAPSQEQAGLSQPSAIPEAAE
jgi:uncharacterized membrane protein